MRAQEPSVSAELYLSRSRRRVLARRDGARDGVEIAESLGAGVRVMEGGRVGFASSGAADPETLRGLWRRAVEQLPHAETQTGRALPGPAGDAPDAAFDASLWDESLFARPWEELDARLGQAESAASAGGRARVLRSELAESRGEVVVANTLGRAVARTRRLGLGFGLDRGGVRRRISGRRGLSRGSPLRCA